MDGEEETADDVEYEAKLIEEVEVEKTSCPYPGRRRANNERTSNR